MTKRQEKNYVRFAREKKVKISYEFFLVSQEIFFTFSFENQMYFFFFVRQ